MLLIIILYNIIKLHNNKMQEYSSNVKDQGIKIWTYNVFLRPPPIKNNHDDYKMERFNLIIERIHLYDVICFQELFQTGSFRVEDLIAAGISKGIYFMKNRVLILGDW